MSENVREVLEAAIEKIMPAAPPKTWTDAQWDEWFKKRTRFKRFLDAEAYTDAALMLVPEGWDSIDMRRTDDGLWRVQLAGNDSHLMAEDTDEFFVEAEDKTNLWDAIAQAALAAKGTGDE